MTVSLEIKQDFKYQGDDWWKWWIWVDGPDRELDQIDHVVYTLHRTFPDPVRKVKDRATKFRLDTAGWGVFRIFAKVVLRNGKSERLTHELELRYPDGRATEA